MDVVIIQMKNAKRILLALALTALSASATLAQYRNDKILNRPYADGKAWHLGFSVGMHTEDLIFTHNGFITEDGEQWQIEQPGFQPGFNVTALLDLRLNDFFNFRFTPGLLFGSRDLVMREQSTGEKLRQSLKSTYVILPMEMKFSSLRMKNMRPYIIGGIMPAFDVSKKSSDYIKLNSSDFYLTIGFGSDFYLPYFKFIPEIKFCFGLKDVLMHDRPDLVDDPGKFKITQSLAKATGQMVILSFYFE